ncbi:protein charybde-like [Dermatophagoides farinae]|uniref:Protein charybde-like n=1 Tax=Dermatophagoides farinae TaxID=6954 RepID=A0A9D4P3A7_DERFA|nr:protein charybde-like [Dermatophagoides farinae]
MPPMSYMNGNSVRPIRRRHFSQQQTGGIYVNNDGNGGNGNGGGGDNCNQNGIIDTNLSMNYDNNIYEWNNRNKMIINTNDNKKISSQANNVTNTTTTTINSNKTTKGIENILRLAKETRLVHCTEILIPQMLMQQIVTNVIEMAECEPCGLRGCLLLIFIENDDDNVVVNNNNNSNSNNNNNNNNRRRPNNNNNNHQYKINTSSTKLLGEFVIDPDIVPTFEVFLTLKRVKPSWFESLEYRFFKRTPIILSEIYLLNKKKLYQPSSI